MRRPQIQRVGPEVLDEPRLRLGDDLLLDARLDRLRVGVCRRLGSTSLFPLFIGDRRAPDPEGSDGIEHGFIGPDQPGSRVAVWGGGVRPPGCAPPFRAAGVVRELIRRLGAPAAVPEPDAVRVLHHRPPGPLDVLVALPPGVHVVAGDRLLLGRGLLRHPRVHVDAPASGVLRVEQLGDDDGGPGAQRFRLLDELPPLAGGQVVVRVRVELPRSPPLV